MKKLSGLSTNDGKPIYNYGHIEELRAAENEKRKKKQLSRTFISQKGAQEYVQHSDADLDGTGGNRGGGKANPYYTPVATPSGFRKMGDLEVGDLICTPYDGVQKVSNIFEQGEHTVYHFYFDDGTSVTCMDNHRFWARPSAEEDFRVMTAREIISRYKLDIPFPMSLRAKYHDYVEIPLCGQVEMNENMTEADLPLHPFVLGFISGTGFWEFGHAEGIKLSNDMFFVRTIDRLGYRITKNRQTGYYYLRGLSDENRRKITTVRVKQAARIPQEYKTASIKARWEYLRGVIYKNGHSKRRVPYLILPNKKLIEDIAEVARSLGVWCHIDQVTDIPDKIGEWRICFVAPNDSDLFFRGNYKSQARQNAPHYPTNPNDQTMLTKKIQYIRKGNRYPCRCITVTGRDHLYLTDAYTINHNTAMLITKPLPDTSNRYFKGIVLRKNKKDFDNIIGEIDKWYEPLGRYNKSADDMTFYFKSGAQLALTHYDMSEQQFDDRVRGQQYAYIGIDEVTQISFEWFKKLMRSNRNTNNIKSRMLFTCNPDPLSWFRKWIDWYVGKADTVYADGKVHPERKGLIIPERSGVIRYFYSPDDVVDNTIWGNSPHEVYMQIKDIADEAWDPQLAEHGLTRENFMCKSFRFTKADLMDNKVLMDTDPDYYKNLLNAPIEIRERELGGNWDIIKTGDDMIQPYHLDYCFHNGKCLNDNVRRASCDAASDGGDNCVLWFKIGNHIQDIFVCKRNFYETVPLIKAKLREWGVNEENFVFDEQGIGNILKGAFPNAVGFNNQAKPDDPEDRLHYDTQKSQCAYMFALHTQQGEWSIESTLLDREFTIGKTVMKLDRILQMERKAIRKDLSKEDRGWCLIPKELMKSKTLVGHSPDFIESLMMFEVFNMEEDDVEVPDFLHGHVSSIRTFDFTN